MKFFLKALKDLLVELIMACISLPVLIFCIVVFELLDPFVRFYDAIKFKIHNDKKDK